MKTKTIYLLRHGETDFNKNKMVQGRGVNASLNATGQKQAALAVRYFSTKSIEKVFCSLLIRTEETIQGLGLPITCLEGFDEISWGTQEGKIPDEHSLGSYWDTVRAWRAGSLDLTVGGGETPIEVMERQKKAMEVVLSCDEENILICMHGRAIRILLAWLLNYPLKYMDGFEHQNCSVYELKYTGTSFRLANYNYIKHLLGEH